MKNIFILVIHFQMSQLFKSATMWILLPTNAKLGRIVRIMEINIWLSETLFVLSIQIFEGQYFLYEGRKLIAFHMSLQCLSMLI